MDMTHCLIHSSVDGLLGVSIFWLLGIMLLRTILYTLCGHRFSILLGLYLGVELWGHKVNLLLLCVVWGTTERFSKVFVLSLFLPAMCESSSFFTSLGFPYILLVNSLLKIVIWMVLLARNALTVIGSKRRHILQCSMPIYN